MPSTKTAKDAVPTLRTAAGQRDPASLRAARTSVADSGGTYVDGAALGSELSPAHRQLTKEDPKLASALKGEHAQIAHADSHHDPAKAASGAQAIYLRNDRADPDAPRAWPAWKRYAVVGLASWLNNLVTIGASGYSTGVEAMTKEFGVSSEVGTLGLSLYVLGFAFGPLLVAPLSEYYGRRPVYLISWFVFVVFQIPLALAPNIGTVLVCRFIQGFSGSAPLANTGGVVHDLFPRDEAGLAVAIYALSSTDGPPFGNVSIGYLGQNKGWRWIFWFNLILFGAFLPIIYFCLPETRDTILMMRKAKRLRKETGNENIFAEHEKDRTGWQHLYKVSLLRPFKFLLTEPITYLTALINGFTYGLIFLSNEGFPLIFGPGNNGHGWTHSGTVNLTFLAYVVGSLIGFAIQPLQEALYRRGIAKRGKWPEGRWATSLVGVFFMPLGLFIAAWTSYRRIPWIAPIIGFTVFGVGFFMIINAILCYVVDSYGHYAASALGGVVFVRNIAGAGFPLFAEQMFKKLGNQWALCLLAFLALFMIPVPFLLYHKGERVRYKSPYCREHMDDDD